MITMQFYVFTDSDGNVHVQNAVAGMLGQHHVHTPEDFERWRKDSDDVREMGGSCGCGLQPGQVRDGTTGKVSTMGGV